MDLPTAIRILCEAYTEDDGDGGFISQAPLGHDSETRETLEAWAELRHALAVLPTGSPEIVVPSTIPTQPGDDLASVRPIIAPGEYSSYDDTRDIDDPPQSR